MSAPPAVLISDDLDPRAAEILREAGLEVRVQTGLGEDALIRELDGVSALIVRSSTKVTRRVIEASRLRVVGRAGIGVDNVDCEAATERGVVVMNTPTGNATTTAEHAIALLVALARHVPRADRFVRAGGWARKGALIGTELTGKTLGVVGLGRIGRLVAERAQGLRMRVVAHDPYLAQSDKGSPVPGVELAPLADLLARADFVTLHVPLSDATRGLIAWEEIALMKPGARLINASRGGVVDEEAVLDALSEGRLAGAAFDVLEEEPPPADHPFLSRDDVILTPHLGASSSEAQERVALDIARQVAAFLKDGVAENAVNAPALDAETIAALAPFLRLGETLGGLLAQLCAEPVRKLEITLGGEIARRGPEHVKLAVLVGCLRRSQAEGVNFVNAPLVARERGLRVLASESDEPVYRLGEIKVRASARAGGVSRAAKGAVFGREPRIVRIDGVHLDLPTRGTLLLTRHADAPGVLGRIGTVLGRHGVNIRRVELGPPRDEDGGLAAGFLTLYDEPAPEVIAEIQALDAIESVELVHL